MKIKNLVILQARMSSSRLPGKVMMPLNGMPMIFWQIQRLMQATSNLELVVATSIHPTDDPLVEYLLSKNLKVHRGALTNVFSRFLEISESQKYHAMIRITGDCPLFMPEILDTMLSVFNESNVDYLSNTLKRSFPDGLDIEIFRKGVIEKLATLSLTHEEMEHVTLGIYSRPNEFSLLNYSNSSDLSDLRWTVDYREDFDFVAKVYSHFAGREVNFRYREVLDYLKINPEVGSNLCLPERNIQL